MLTKRQRPLKTATADCANRNHPYQTSLSATESGLQQYPWTTEVEDVQWFKWRRPCQQTSSLADPLSATESRLQQYPWTTEDVQWFKWRRPCQQTSSLADPLSATESGLQQYPWTTEDVQWFKWRRPCQQTSSLADPYRLQNQGSSNTRGLRKMCNGLNAEDRAKRHHPSQIVPLSVQ